MFLLKNFDKIKQKIFSKCGGLCVRLRRYAKQCWEVAGSAIAIYLTIDVGINARSTKIQYKIL